MVKTNANLIWKIADLLRGPYQPDQYGDVILPFTILRRLDCILEPTKDEVPAAIERQRIREEAERLAEVQAVDWTRDGEPAGRRIFWLELESRWGRAAKGIA